MSLGGVVELFRGRPRDPVGEGGRMSLGDHFRELRARIMRCSLYLVLGTIVALFFWEQLFDLIYQPYRDASEALDQKVQTQAVITGIGSPLLLQQLRTLRFHPVDNENLLCFTKTDPGSDDAVLVVVSLNSTYTQIGTTSLDLPALGLDWSDRSAVTDETTGATYDWGQFNYVELDPHREPAHVFTVHRPAGSGPVARA